MSKSMILRDEILDLMIKNEVPPSKGLRVLFNIIFDAYLLNRIEPDECKKSLDSLYGIYLIDYKEKYENDEQEEEKESIKLKDEFINDLKDLKDLTVEKFLRSEKSLDKFLKIAKRYGMSSKIWDTNDQ